MLPKSTIRLTNAIDEEVIEEREDEEDIAKTDSELELESSVNESESGADEA